MHLDVGLWILTRTKIVKEIFQIFKIFKVWIKVAKLVMWGRKCDYVSLGQLRISLQRTQSLRDLKNWRLEMLRQWLVTSDIYCHLWQFGPMQKQLRGNVIQDALCWYSVQGRMRLVVCAFYQTTRWGDYVSLLLTKSTMHC